MNISEFGVTEAILDDIADVTIILTDGYKTLSREEVIEIYKESL